MKLGLPISPSFTTSRPTAACSLTLSATALRTRSANAASSTGLPSIRASIISNRSSGRGRLPTCVVSIRSVLSFMRRPAVEMRVGSVRYLAPRARSTNALS
jgi:hypothetical protein